MTDIQLSALRHSAFYSPYLLTLAGGFLRAEGLQPRYRVATAGVADALATGRCHVAQSAVATSFAALERGERPEVVHFAQINDRDGFFIVARRPGAGFEWRDLCGRPVLVDHFFQPHAMLGYGLSRQGLALAQLKVIDGGDVEAMEQAFRAGRADYVHLQGPAAQQLEYDGVGRVVAAVGDLIGPVAFSSLCAHREWLASDMARAFMRAYRKAQRFAVEAPAADIARLEQDAGFFCDVTPQVLTATIQAYQALGCWQLEPRISSASYDTLLEVFLNSGLISRRHPYDAAIVAPP